MSDIKERLDKVRALIQESEFLEGKGLSNEVNMLDVSKELEMDVSIIPKDNPSYEGSNEVEDNAASQKILDVFDVLLAGVEAVD